MNRAITHIRKELIVGQHLHDCFADSRVRAEGWKRIQDAKRLARKLHLSNLF